MKTRKTAIYLENMSNILQQKRSCQPNNLLPKMYANYKDLLLLKLKVDRMTLLILQGDQVIYKPSKQSICKLTVCVSVDVALATRTKTSASKQNLSIHWSKSGDTPTPGLKHQHHSVYGFLSFIPFST